MQNNSRPWEGDRTAVMVKHVRPHHKVKASRYEDKDKKSAHLIMWINEVLLDYLVMALKRLFFFPPSSFP